MSSISSRRLICLSIIVVALTPALGASFERHLPPPHWPPWQGARDQAAARRPLATPIEVPQPGATEHSQAEGAAPLTTTISGTFTDSATGLPVAAWVDVFDATGEWVTNGGAGDDGHYVTGPVPAGTYFVHVNNTDGYYNELYDDIPCNVWCDTSTGTPLVVGDEPVTGIDFALDGGGGRMTGTMTTAAAGAPIGGECIEILDSSGAGFGEGWSWNDGTWISRGALPAGFYFARTCTQHGSLVDELWDDHPCPLGGCDPFGGDPIVVVLAAMTPGIDFALSEGGSITGAITAAADGQPIAGAWAEIHDATGQYLASVPVDGSGVYLAEGLPAGAYFVTSWNDAGYFDELYDDIPCTGGCNITAGTPILVAAGTAVAGIDFALVAGGAVTGRITDAVAGEGIWACAHLATAENHWFATGCSDADGYYTTAAVPPGAYWVHTSNNQGYFDEQWDDIHCDNGWCVPFTGPQVVVGAGTVDGIDFALEPGGGVVSGRLSDDVTGAGLAGCVEILDDSGMPLTFGCCDASGEWVSSGGLEGGVYRARSSVSDSYVGELWDDIPCPDLLCDPTLGTPIPLPAGAHVAGIDLALTPMGPGQPYLTGVFIATGHEPGGYGVWCDLWADDPDGVGDVVSATVEDPHGTLHALDPQGGGHFTKYLFSTSTPPVLGVYTAEVADAGGTPSPAVLRLVDNVVEEITQPIEPLADTWVPTATPTFRWTEVTDPDAPITGYCVQVWSGVWDTMLWVWCGPIPEVVYNSDGTAIGPLVPGHRYHWKAEAHDDHGNFSSTNTFFWIGLWGDGFESGDTSAWSGVAP